MNSTDESTPKTEDSTDGKSVTQKNTTGVSKIRHFDKNGNEIKPPEQKIKLKTKESNELICKRCDTHFDSMDNVVYRGTNRHKAHSICPKCGYGVPVVKITGASGYLRNKKTGQYIRETPKVKMTKKQRRRLNRETSNPTTSN